MTTGMMGRLLTHHVRLRGHLDNIERIPALGLEVKQRRSRDAIDIYLHGRRDI